MNIKIIDRAARPGDEGLWMFQTYSAMPIPDVDEIITIERRSSDGNVVMRSCWKVVRRDWIASDTGLNCNVFVEPQPMGV